MIGLRYIKKDGSCTEDHFLCRKDHESTLERLEVEPHYKKRLEYRLPEYKGAHKEQIDFSQPFVKSGLITQVNTITYTKDSK